LPSDFEHNSASAEDQNREQWTFMTKLFMETSDAVRRARGSAQLSPFVTEIALTVVGTRYEALGPDALYGDLRVLNDFVRATKEEWSPQQFALGMDIGHDALEALLIGARVQLEHTRRGVELVVLDRYLKNLIDARFTRHLVPELIGPSLALEVAQAALRSGDPSAFPVMKASAQTLATGVATSVDRVAEWEALSFDVIRVTCALCGLDVIWPRIDDSPKYVDAHLDSRVHALWAAQGGMPNRTTSEVDEMFPPAKGFIDVGTRLFSSGPADGDKPRSAGARSGERANRDDN
jgi:hypothetical protein